MYEIWSEAWGEAWGYVLVAVVGLLLTAIVVVSTYRREKRYEKETSELAERVTRKLMNDIAAQAGARQDKFERRSALHRAEIEAIKKELRRMGGA